jgi:hypothetical protein
MGTLAHQPPDSRRHRRSERGYVNIAGQVDLVGEPELTAALRQRCPQKGSI